MKTLSLILALSLCASAAEPVTKPTTLPSRPDSYTFHRGEDYAFGLLISAPVGMASRPWIGLVAGEAAGVANEARYGRNFNMVHLAVISAGALTGYGLAKWARHEQHKADKKYGR